VVKGIFRKLLEARLLGNQGDLIYFIIKRFGFKICSRQKFTWSRRLRAGTLEDEHYKRRASIIVILN
jgi:hypothetical protein